MDKLAQQAPQSFRGRMFQRDNAKPKEQRILVLQTGMAVSNVSQEVFGSEAGIPVGTELQMVREADNKYDEWAIALYFGEEMIGYFSRFKNETIARLMDVGKRFVAIVDARDPDPEVRKRIHRKHEGSTEDMHFPFSVYLIEEA